MLSFIEIKLGEPMLEGWNMTDVQREFIESMLEETTAEITEDKSEQEYSCNDHCPTTSDSF